MRPLFPAIVALLFALTITAAQARDYAVPPMPDFPDSAWEVGSSVTYSVRITQAEYDSRCNLRMAVLGTEHEAATDTTLYWVEIDITDVSRLPEDLEAFFIENYGETPNAIRMNMLIPRYDFTRLFLDPSGAYYDLSEYGFIRKLYFQYNRQTPYDVETSLIGGFILPLAAIELVGGELPEDFRTERNLGIVFVEDDEAYATESSEGSIVTPAGEFEAMVFSFTSHDESGPAGLLYFSDQIPVFPCVSYTGDWMGSSSPGHIEAELTGFQLEDAETDIVGQPIKFDLTTLMYGTQASG